MGYVSQELFVTQEEIHIKVFFYTKYLHLPLLLHIHYT